MKVICHATVLRKEKNAIICPNGDAEDVVVIAVVIAVVTVVAAVAEVDIVEVEIVTETMARKAVRELKNAGIAVKKDIWLSNVKNRKEKDPTEEVLSPATIAKLKDTFLAIALKKEL